MVFITKTEWTQLLEKILTGRDIFAPFLGENHLDYRLLDKENIPQIVYHRAIPTTPLKTFLIPVKENVVKESATSKPRVILGVPACDLKALKLLDKIYQDEGLADPFYRDNRARTILIGTDCYEVGPNCHCTAYGIEPVVTEDADISLTAIGDHVRLKSLNSRGEAFLKDILGSGKWPEREESAAEQEGIASKRERAGRQLETYHQGLPDLKSSQEKIRRSGEGVWKKYAEKCVVCGACAVICPSCNCFLLIDRKQLEKVRSWDACQYPSFERVAGGEDPLKKHSVRFQNRYLCKYLFKPEKFGLLACTGCGRCIDACIGKINKNEVVRAL